jgi:hypothetical protein
MVLVFRAGDGRNGERFAAINGLGESNRLYDVSLCGRNSSRNKLLDFIRPKSHSARYTNMGQRPALKQKVRAAIKRRDALALVGKGLPITEIAEQLELTTQSVRRHLRAALATESLFPHTLGAERVAELRTLEGEKLQLAWRKVAGAFDVADPKNGMVIARLAEATAKLNERQAKLWGLDQPERLIAEQWRLNISKSESRVTISWDQNMLAAPAEPVPGLCIGGRTHREALSPLPPVNEPNGNESLDTAAA